MLRASRDSLSRGPGEWASAEQVNVQVEDGLPGAGADVEDGAVSLLDVALARYLGGGQVATADDLGVAGLSLFQSGKMLLGNNEHVRGRLGIDVFEGEHMVVFVHLLGGNLAAEDAAEKTIGGSVSHGLLSFHRMGNGVKGNGCWLEISRVTIRRSG